MRADPGNIATNATAGAATPYLKVEIQWNGVNWIDEGSVSGATYVLGASGQSQIMDPAVGFTSLGTALIGKATVRLRNNTGRYSTSRAGSQAATLGLWGKAIRISAGYAGESVVVFTGRVLDVQEAEATEEVTLTCHDPGSDPRRQKISSYVYGVAAYPAKASHDWIDYVRSQLGIASPSLEHGLMVIPYAWLDDDDGLSEMRTAASSEGGILFFDADGLLTFWNAGHWADVAAADAITVASFAELAPRRDWANTYNIIGCQYAPRKERGIEKVYSLKRTLPIGPGETHSDVLNFQWPLASFNYYDMTVCTAGGADMSASITLDNATPTAGQRWAIEFTNSHAYQTAYVTQFDVFGSALDGRQAETYLTTNLGTDQDRRYDVPRNAYVQTEEQAIVLTDMLADRLATPRLVATATNMRANPLWQLGDIITVTAALTGMASDFILTGITWQWSDAYVMTAQLVKADLYPHSGYFRAETAAGVLGAGGNVAFY
jgi:hypothetical protein